MENFAGSKIKLERTRLNSQTAPINMVMWNLQIQVVYILGKTDIEKDRLQHPQQKSNLRLNINSERFS